ncbi:DUF551 domain-containing protein [Salmonella enterica]|uniref:DUF551 domain-containing protein n=2 Tax=Salmonella enterica TaxID=28901 RepID=UPI0005EDCFB4|nr:DUF551 domain-containing protein [Salmonella enterica]EDP8611620.1 DUF551 domain-containing protein [Salmonella enterica subsp. enterica serovar Livingstone]EEI7102556.1 DUF551 domain-containing protein [Salmonella enterica subsp. enterica serovar Livingstone]EGD0954966.1 DUF551 domain-containing protein [Salmonella enterica]EGP2361596.1 DUF551 domain-containing protein [Salmonella enterica subsp. enterica serovar Livingstone]KJK70952.1 hypothetical protein VN13_11880 [Salmonella enterica s
MTTITKEEVKAFIEQIESDLSNGWEAQIFELKLARIALASLEAEKGADPVVFTDERNLHHIARGRETSLIWGKQNQEVGDIPLYRHAQPVPVVPEDISGIIERFQYQADHLSEWHHIDEHSCKVNRRDLVTALEFMNSCRAAMLQGSQPVTTSKKLPFEQWLSQQTGTIDVECGCVMTEVFFHWLRVAYEAGNSPATPDCWIKCSERMPDNDESKPIAIFTGKCLGQGMFVATYDDDGFFDYWEGMEIIGVTHWMPMPAAPQQEAE